MSTPKIKPSEQLKLMILEKELAQKNDEIQLRTSLKNSLESLNPMNIIKNTITGVITSPNIKTDIIQSIVGFSSGFIAKKLFTRKSNSLLVNIEGMILQMLVANKVARNSDEISNVASGIFQKIKNWMNPKKESKEA